MQKNIKRRQVLKVGMASGLGFIIPGQAQANNIRQLNGTVFINKRKASGSDSIVPGDLITTSHNGKIAFTVGADAFLLKENTSIQVGEIENPVLSLLQLLTGKILGVFETGRQRQIVTANTTIGIRGTACFLNATPRQLYYCNCYGKTTLRNADHVAHFDATRHSAYNLNVSNGQVSGNRVNQVLDHDDDELRMLEALVGRVPPFDQA